jgi:hypothetical protein
MGATDFYFAIDLQPVAADPISGRGSQWLALIGRLKGGRTQDGAQREIAAIRDQLMRDYPRDNRNLVAVPLRDALVGDSRTPLLVVMASALLVLLIACANLAGAVLSRSISRRAEFALRTALGAGRQRLVRQVLSEAALLAVLGGAVGLTVARFMLTILRDVRLAALPAYADVSLDWGAVLVTAALTLGTGLVFGLAPAIFASRSDPERVLREATRGTSESRGSGRLRGALVAGQIALCTSLLMGAGLLGRSLWAMTTAPLGFTDDRVLAATVRLPSRNYRRRTRGCAFMNSSPTDCAPFPVSTSSRPRAPCRLRSGSVSASRSREGCAGRTRRSRSRWARSYPRSISACCTSRCGQAARLSRVTAQALPRLPSSAKAWRGVSGRPVTRWARASGSGRTRTLR